MRDAIGFVGFSTLRENYPPNSCQVQPRSMRPNRLSALRLQRDLQAAGPLRLLLGGRRNGGGLAAGLYLRRGDILSRHNASNRSLAECPIDILLLHASHDG